MVILVGAFLSAGVIPSFVYAAENSQVNDTQKIPEPDSWSFPEVIESARAISPENIEGRPFDQFGMAYSSGVLKELPIASMTAQELQKYADIVTHAYPDAVFKSVPASSKEISLDKMNETTFANIAYISLHAINPDTRFKAAEFLREFQERWKNRENMKYLN